MQNIPSLISEDFLESKKTEVLSGDTVNAVELGLLAQNVDHSMTSTGRSVLYNSLLNPSISLNEITQKQEALQEIRANDKLRQGIIDVLERAKELEEDSMLFLNRTLHAFFSTKKPYDVMPAARKLIMDLPKIAMDMPEPESVYLKGLKNSLTSLDGSPVHRLAKGPIFRGLFKKEVFGLTELNRKNWKISPFPYYNLQLKFGQTGIGGGVGTLLFYLLDSSYDPAKASLSEHLAHAFYGTLYQASFLGGGAFIGYQIGRARDTSNFHRPVQKRLFLEGQEAYQAIGALDELLSFDEFGKSMKFSTIPKMHDEKKDFFVARSFINPVQYLGVKNTCHCDDGICSNDEHKKFLVKPIPNYIPNDVVVGNGSMLTFMTGPNSGGKTSAAKAIIQSRILAQAGSYVPASHAEMNIAHQLHYQVGDNDSQADEEGGLGTQFLQTKKILFNGNSRTFVAIDDLIEGTTIEAKLKHTREQLCGFLHKGQNVLYITHHYELAQEFREKGVGEYIQVEFDGENPTHRIIPGISTDSHSEVVAKRTGFDEKAITQHLWDTGYLKPGQALSDISAFAHKNSN